MKYHYNLKFMFFISIYWNVIYSCDGKAEFKKQLLQISLSRDHSDIILLGFWFGDRFIIIINDYYQCWKQLCCLVTNDTFFQDSFDEQKVYLFEVNVFCNIINVFTLMNSMHSFWIKVLFSLQNLKSYRPQTVYMSVHLKVDIISY